MLFPACKDDGDFFVVYLLHCGISGVAAIVRYLKEVKMASTDAVIAGLQSLERRLVAQVSRQELATQNVKLQLAAIREQIRELSETPIERVAKGK